LKSKEPVEIISEEPKKKKKNSKEREESDQPKKKKKKRTPSSSSRSSRSQKNESTVLKLSYAFSVQNGLTRLFEPFPDADQGLQSLTGIKVICMAFVVLGSTFYRTLLGSIQNMQVLQEWVHCFSFSFVLASDYVIDVFFVLSAFLATYFVLRKMRDNEGEQGSFVAYGLHLYMRHTPLYAFNLFFFWKIVSLFGDGPNFFMFYENSQCSYRWYWHLVYLNNLIPVSSDDNCMGWTWCLANNF